MGNTPVLWKCIQLDTSWKKTHRFGCTTEELRVAAHAVRRTAAPDTRQGGKGCVKRKDNDEPV